MITFSRSGNEVKIQIKHGLFYNDECFTLDIQQSYNYQAELLRKALQENLNNKLEQIRRDAYNEG